MQLKLDFDSPPPIFSGKKTERVTIACPEELKEILSIISRIRNIEPATLAYFYLVKGIEGDIGKTFSIFPHLKTQLNEVISKFQK